MHTEDRKEMPPINKTEGNFVPKDVRLPRAYTFVEGDAESIVDGSSVHPHFMHVFIKRTDALTFALNILRQLEHPRPDADPLLEIPLFGQLELVTDGVTT